MTLALRLGKTLNELNKTLTASELQMWLAYDRRSPLGDWRGDMHAAQITAAVFNAQGAEASVDEFMPKFGETGDEEQTAAVDEGEGQFEALFNMLAQ
ncbi:phage tail assembly protein T [Enterobacillus tribolii]|uniref:Uncharacterized protein DUF4035 n=1 Tax=Enterobacillus tribolii TaxID=1487935 RepID=A0A370R2S6_9GAMM|nr:DUF4035 domain-containing protein [Enterobacillus tribolii]MBW7984724.1 DUF4035 domain-containing protein [Enterobacillus tribolii]RDK96724.1 uncharacterized protein DUF4035 [Enterobacillus tribolii]